MIAFPFLFSKYAKKRLDPGKIVITGAGGCESALGCGVQKPRAVIIGFFPKSNSSLATAGEVATIEFQ